MNLSVEGLPLPKLILPLIVAALLAAAGSPVLAQQGEGAPKAPPKDEAAPKEKVAPKEEAKPVEAVPVDSEPVDAEPVEGEAVSTEVTLAIAQAPPKELTEAGKKRQAFIDGVNEKSEECVVDGGGDDLKAMSFTCDEKIVEDMAAGLKVTCKQYKKAGFETVELFGTGEKMLCTVGDECVCGEKEPIVIVKTATDRLGFIDGINAKSQKCVAAGQGEELKGLLYTCKEKAVEDMAAGLKVTCDQYSEVQFAEVELVGDRARMVCEVSEEGCKCGERIKIPQPVAVRQAMLDDEKKINEGCEVSGEGEELKKLSYVCEEKELATMKGGFEARCDKYKDAEFTDVELKGKDARVACTVTDEACACGEVEIFQVAVIEEPVVEEPPKEIQWLPGWNAGLQLGWAFNGLNELNDAVIEPNNVEPADAAGLLRFEAQGGLYITDKSLINVFFGGLNSIGSNTAFSLTYGGIEPALVFPEEKFELILGLRVGLGGYVLEGTNPETAVAGIGYEGLASVVEPNLTLRAIVSEELTIDVRLGFMQFIALDSTPRGGAVDLNDVTDLAAGDTPLDFAAPTFSVGFTWGQVPPRPEKKADKAEEGDEEGDDKEGDEDGDKKDDKKKE